MRFPKPNKVANAAKVTMTNINALLRNRLNFREFPFEAFPASFELQLTVTMHGSLLDPKYTYINAAMRIITHPNELVILSGYPNNIPDNIINIAVETVEASDLMMASPYL